MHLERSWGGVLGTDQLGEGHMESPGHQANKWKDEERCDDQVMVKWWPLMTVMTNEEVYKWT